MNAKQKIHQAKLNQWIGLFKEQADSSLTVRQWCEKNNYSFHTYNYWKHILKEEYASAALPDIVPVLPSNPALPTPVPSNEVSGMTQTISCNSRDLRGSCHAGSCNAGTIRITIGDTEISLSPSAVSTDSTPMLSWEVHVCKSFFDSLLDLLGSGSKFHFTKLLGYLLGFFASRFLALLRMDSFKHHSYSFHPITRCY